MVTYGTVYLLDVNFHLFYDFLLKQKLFVDEANARQTSKPVIGNPPRSAISMGNLQVRCHFDTFYFEPTF